MAKLFGMNIGGSSDEKEAEKYQNVQRVQDYLNKFKQTSREVSTQAKKSDNGDWQGYSWIQNAVDTVDDRAVRYQEYREMTKVPELNQGLNIYADNGTQLNVENKVIDIQSENNNIIEILTDLFFNRLDINSNIWHIMRNMCKLGDEFEEVVVDNLSKPTKIISIERFSEPEKLERNEEDGNLKEFVYHVEEDESSDGKDLKKFQPWQVVHFRIEEEEYEPYGKSILEAGRRTWKKLSLMEDAMLIYRISRAPERRVFYIDVGNLPTREANLFIEHTKRKFRKKSFINPSTGQIDEKANPLATDEDFFIPVRQNSQGTRIETLPGGQNLGEVDDVKMFRDQILKTMAIPPAYLGGQEGGGMFDPKSLLSQQDIQFARTVERIQRFVIRGLEKIAIIELAFNDVDPAEFNNFKIVMTAPSNVDQLMEIEIRNQQFGLISSIKSIGGEVPFLSDEWIYRNVLQMSDQEINKERLKIQMQIQMMAQLQGGGEEAGGGGAGGGSLGGNILGGGAAPGIAGGPGEGGGEDIATMGAEAGAEGEAPEMGGEEGGGEGGPELEIASNWVEFDGANWLFENKKDMKKLLKYINLYEKVHKDNNEDKPKTENSNSLTRMAIKGEFRGILKAVQSEGQILVERVGKSKHKKIRTLTESKNINLKRKS